MIGGDGLPDDAVAMAQYSGPMRTTLGSGKSPATTGFVYGGGSAGGGVYSCASARTPPSARIASTSAAIGKRLRVLKRLVRRDSCTGSNLEPVYGVEVPAPARMA